MCTSYAQTVQPQHGPLGRATPPGYYIQMLSTMHHNTEAVRALKAGCQRLHLPEETATELVRFLQAKRVHDQFLSPTARPRNMSPGAAVDKLWHFMLLNTDISSAVHELVGGVVRHAGTDEDDLDDGAKRMQRLYAMSIMAREGWQPHVNLWVDPGTNMSYIAPMTQPDGPTLYICPDMTNADVTTLKADIARVYSNNSDEGSRKRKAPEPATVTARDTGPESASGSGSDRRDDFVGCNRLQPVRYGFIAVRVSDGSSYNISISSADPVQGMTAAELKQRIRDVPASQLRVVAVQYGVSNLCTDIGDTTVIPVGSIVRLLLPGSRAFKAPRSYQVFVKSLTGRIMDLSNKVAPWMTVEELKLVIQAQMGFPPDLQRIIYIRAVNRRPTTP